MKPEERYGDWWKEETEGECKPNLGTKHDLPDISCGGRGGKRGRVGSYLTVHRYNLSWCFNNKWFR